MDLSEYRLELLPEKDEEFALYRGHARRPETPSVLLRTLVSSRPARESLKKLEHEYSLRTELDAAWAVRPLTLSKYKEQQVLVLEDPGGEPLDRLIQGPMEISQFLRLAIGLAFALSHLHKRDLLHKNVKPGNVLVDSATGHAWLMGFGIASRLLRERQSPEPPEFIAGTLPYMAPEQTGRMNRSIDSRSDLYAFGVTLYEMLTGTLPFMASDPMGWVHCQIARQPVPPHEVLTNVPRAVSAIIMRLLAKTPEERYQTAAGVQCDLRRCLAEWETQGGIEEFVPGEHDKPDRLLIPEKLYGRTREIDTLLSSFDRVVAGRRPELVLVSGYSGIGKSALVNELHKPLVPPRGLFASGKFDQYKRDIPYATLAQAFQSLIRPLLSKSEEELSRWREALREALGPNGLLIVDLVPELKLIIGEQPPVPELPLQEAQSRFQLVFRRFISVFARPEHPLALFLDDLQWLDAATLDLLEDLLTRTDVQHLMLIGAYRDNEVNPAHPLMRKLEAMRQAGAILQDIVLAPLVLKDLGQLIADSLGCELEGAAPLAQLIDDKTGGNPFFAIQFFSTLAEEGLLTFDFDQGHWSWDLNRIHAKGYTDNVVDLMIRKLSRLPSETQKALQQLACLGNSAEFAILRIVYQDSEEEIHGQLWEAVRQGLIFRSEESYRFLHDRVQEAAYSLIPEELRAEAHLRIGRRLAARTSLKEREHWIFEIVNQLTRGAALISSRDEKEQLAEFDLIAGKRAKASTAYVSALRYLVAGKALLPDDGWVCRPDLMFPLEFHRAECEFLTGELAAAEKRLTMLVSHAANTVERATVECLRIDLYTALDQADRGVASCLDYLRHLGIEWSPHPTDAEARREFERIWSQLGSRTIEQLIDLPLMNDPASLATLDVLTKSYTPAMFTDVNLLSMTVCRAVNLSLEQGHSDGSCVAYVFFAKIAGPHFNDYKAGFRFGQLGFQLVEKRGFGRFQARTSLWFAQFVVPWTKHIRDCRELMRRALEAATKAGDLIAAVYSFDNLNTNFLAAGDPLLEAQRQAENGLELAERAQFGHVIATQLGLIRTLRGLTYKFGCLDDRQFNEVALERHFAANPALKEPECQYWIRKLQARFFAGDYPSALDAAARARPLLWTSASMFETAEYHFYAALSHAASCASAVSDRNGPAFSRLAEDVPPSSRRTEYQQHFEALAAHQEQQEIWAKNCPENFENRAALVGAEIARIEGRILDAEQLYEKAIHSARENGFVHNEALANEVAARFYLGRGYEKIAYAYLQDARYGYLRWGATGKVQQLDSLYPRLRQQELIAGSTSTIGTSVEQLDLATVIKVSQAVSSEMVLEKLIDSLMRAALEHAGAERALLISPRHGVLQIEAEATTTEGDVLVTLGIDAGIAAAMPESLIRYIMRTRESVILKDASSQNPFSDDPYIAQRRLRSILTLPLINRGKLISILHLENNLTPDVFTPDRIIVLKLLASLAANSLENSRLYRDLESRERKIGRLIDSNIIGVVIWDMDGRLLDANDAFLRMVGYDREDVKAGLRWFDMTPPDWQEVHARYEAEELAATGMMQAREKEYFRKDGSRVPVLIGAACFEDQPNQGVAYILDLTRQKQTEEALRRSEAYLAQAQKIAHMGSWVWQVTDRKVVYISDEWYRVYGFDPGGGMPTWEERLQRVHPEDRAKLQATFDRAIDEKSDYDLEFRILPPDAAVRYVHSVGHPVFGSSGELVQFVGVVMDVTESKQAQQAFRLLVVGTAATTGSDFFHSLVRHMAQALRARYALVTTCDDQKHARTLAFWKGDGFWENFDFDIADTPCEKVLHGEVCHYRQGLQGLFPLDKFLTDWKAESYLGVPMLDGRNRVIGHIAILDDKPMEADSRTIDLLKIFASRAAAELKRQKAEDELQAALQERERMREQLAHLAHLNRVSTMGELAASLAHEIKQPISAALTDAKTCLRWLSRDQPDLPEAQDAASRVVKDATHATEIISRISSLFKKGALQRESIEVNTVIQEMIALLGTEEARYSITIHSALTDGLPNIYADRIQIQQVLMNLMINAIEAMKDMGSGGELTIKSQQEDDGQVLVSVRDTGKGLRPEHEKQIFNAFFTTKPQGTGMGLAISRSIIESHGGHLWATSNAGPGATFQFSLPNEAMMGEAAISDN
jgi:PAS domain S-box-containing protein